MDGSIVFVRWRQCASHPTHASLGPPDSISQMGYRLVQPFLTAHGRRSLYFTIGRPFPPKLLLCMGNLDPHLIHASWAHPIQRAKQHLDRFSHFCWAHDRQKPLEPKTHEKCKLFATVCSQKCSKCPPFVRTHAGRRFPHWSTAVSLMTCRKLDHTAIKHSFSSLRTVNEQKAKC